jgi:uncharacterized integral membrane protein (TIGR00697 family)
MPLANELIFLLHIVAAGGLLLLAARLGQSWIVALVAACTILMNVAVTKNITLLGLQVTGGNVLFATVFLANDVVNEHYGRPAARRVVLIGFATGLFVLVMTQFVLAYVPAPEDQAQPHLQFLFGIQAYPRIVVASLVSYLLAQLLDVSIYHALRVRTGAGRLLWLRSNASTWISQAFDTVFFTTAGLTGGAAAPIQTWTQWRDVIIFSYLVKIVVAALDTPFLYCTLLKPLRPPGSRRWATNG